MLIKQIIEFELWGPGPPSWRCTPQLVVFHYKTKISEENRQMLLFSAKMLQEAMYFPFPYLGQITYKI